MEGGMPFNHGLILARLQESGLVLVVLGLSLAVRKWLLSRLAKAAEANPNGFLSVLSSSLAAPTLLWCLILAIDVMLGAIELSPRVERIGHNIVVSFLILSLTMVASSVLIQGLHQYGERHHLPFAVAGLSRTLTRAFVFGAGFSVLLGFLGVSITPVWTALGVGGLAVALALQDTLANLFAGVHILVERPIAVGDYIRLSADEEGTVSDIGWRTTRLLTGANSMVVIPNKTITSGNLLNYSMPADEVTAWVPIVLGLDADIAAAERIAVAAAVATEDVVPAFTPVFIADPGMTATHLQYRLVFRVPRQTQAGLIRTKVVSRMLDGFRKAQISLPEVRPR